jgi:hypothetical protein
MFSPCAHNYTIHVYTPLDYKFKVMQSDDERAPPAKGDYICVVQRPVRVMGIEKYPDATRQCDDLNRPGERDSEH